MDPHRGRPTVHCAAGLPRRQVLHARSPASIAESLNLMGRLEPLPCTEVPAPLQQTGRGVGVHPGKRALAAGHLTPFPARRW